MAWLRDVAARIRGDPADPWLPAHVLCRDRETIAAAQATASAVRHLSQREAAFPREALFKSALDFGLPTTIGAIEQRVSSLVRSGELVPGSGEHKGWLTRSEEHTSELQSLMRISYAVFCLKKKHKQYHNSNTETAHD